ncbi:ABC transporter permease [Spirochaeta africana]|uniref:ABC-type transport system, involved in lipoprotein release, permease component n=1 Tax=Spirochaeta africana (strain ATCC 700263 / DSM 8902 / Z-7692) TaxID=889378 RepID=H9UF82_SPIAZ|nr:FtsX-like permease family protein [Spirochaeta africana]AFG36175.1 ABC-type transport system, involved in lipoprotein release, permease component [Spirochaeta africana DSM 8902]
MIGLIKLAWRNFSRHIQRYRVLLLALILVVAVLVFVLGTVIGMTETLRGKAGRYFAGNVALQGFEPGSRSRIEHPERVEQIIRDLDAGIDAWSRRSVYYGSDASLFYGGFYARQRRLVGVEWDLERPILQNFDFVAGGLPEPGDVDGLLISTAAAEMLGAQVGDDVLITLQTDAGQINTVRLLVRGIFAESSFFGFTSYMDREVLNRLQNLPLDTVNEMGLYVADRGSERRAANQLLARLEQEPDLATFPMIASREQRSELRRDDWEGTRYAVLTLEAQLAEITDLLDALSIVAGVVIFLFLGIVVVGVSNTYSMIVYERSREIGTLRALGLRQQRTVALFLLESLFLGLVGVVLGFILGLSVLQVVQGVMDFSDYNWATLFLLRGRLQWSLPLRWGLGITAIALAAILLGCVRSAVQASRIAPVDALRQS